MSVNGCSSKQIKFVWEESVFSGQVKNKYPKQDNTWLPQIKLLLEAQLKEILKLLNYTRLFGNHNNFLL